MQCKYVWVRHEWNRPKEYLCDPIWIFSCISNNGYNRSRFDFVFYQETVDSSQVGELRVFINSSLKKIMEFVNRGVEARTNCYLSWNDLVSETFKLQMPNSFNTYVQHME